MTWKSYSKVLMPVLFLLAETDLRAQSEAPPRSPADASSVATIPEAIGVLEDTVALPPAVGLLPEVGQQGAPDGDEVEPLVTDRPDFTESSSTVGSGRVQLESGYTFTRDTTSQSRLEEHVLPELLLRIGLSDEVELRLGWEGYIISGQRDRAVGVRDTVDGGTDMDVGFKLELTEQECWLPETALLTAISLPTGADAFSADRVQSVTSMLYSWEVGELLAIGGSTGLASLREGEDDFVEAFQSLAAGVPLTERLGTYFEWFAFFRTDAEDNGPEHFLNGGVTYLLTPDLQVDWRAGFGLNGRSADFFTGVGFAVRY